VIPLSEIFMPNLVFILLFPLALAAAAAFAAWRKTARLKKEAEAAVPQAGQTVDVDGGRIHFLDLGPRDAPALVMIHGLSGQLQHFTYAMTDPLAQDHRVIALDRPGCGYSERDTDTLAALPEQARMIWQALDKIGIKTPVLVGHSLGGAVSLAMALQRPEAVAGLALIAPLTHPTDQTADSFKGLMVSSPLLRRLLGHTIAVPAAQRTAAAVLTEVFSPEPCPDSFLTAAGAALGLRPKAFVTASADIVAAHSGIATQAAQYDGLPEAPAGVLFGAQDAVISATTHGTPMRAYGFSVTLLPDRGHMLPITDPDTCIRFVRDIATQAHSPEA
jgi:pimeloyl-ACP methyl ester carboxylesterase